MENMENFEFEKLKMLLDYTKFHLGVYLSLLTGIVAFVSSDWGPPLRSPASRMLYCSVVLLAMAGACGGVVGATAVGYDSYKTFSSAWIGPGSLQLMTGAVWASLEHWLFWTAVTLMVIALAIFAPRGRHAKK